MTRTWSTRLNLAVAVCAAVGATTLVPAADAAPVAAAPSAGVTVNGRVQHVRHLSPVDLQALPQRTVSVTFRSGSGPQAHTYTGPLVYDVVQLAQPRVRATVKNDQLRNYVAATAASDGYRAIVSWGEIDPSYEAKQVLLALTEDGVPLGPRELVLVVPGDAFGGRYVSGVTYLRVGSADAP